MFTLILLYLLIGSLYAHWSANTNGAMSYGLILEFIIAWPYHLYKSWRY